MIQETLEKFLHPPPLATLVLVVSIVFLLPHQHRQKLIALVEHVLAVDLMSLLESIPSPWQAWAMLGFIINPLARILLGWEQEELTQDGGFRSFGIPVLHEHRNATNTTALPDRSKITSRVQLSQLNNAAAQGECGFSFYQTKGVLLPVTDRLLLIGSHRYLARSERDHQNTTCKLASFCPWTHQHRKLVLPELCAAGEKQKAECF